MRGKIGQRERRCPAAGGNRPSPAPFVRRRIRRARSPRCVRACSQDRGCGTSSPLQARHSRNTSCGHWRNRMVGGPAAARKSARPRSRYIAMTGAYRMAFACIADGGREHLAHWQLAEAGVEIEPRIDRSGNGDRQRTDRGAGRSPRGQAFRPVAPASARWARRPDPLMPISSPVAGSWTMANRSPPMPLPVGSISPSAALAANCGIGPRCRPLSGYRARSGLPADARSRPCRAGAITGLRAPRCAHRPRARADPGSLPPGWFRQDWRGRRCSCAAAGAANSIAPEAGGGQASFCVLSHASPLP